MTCEQALELISASLDGELTLEEQARLQAHLDTCPDCRALQAQLAGIHQSCPDAFAAAPPAELKEQIMSALPAQKAPARVLYWKRWGAMAAAIAVVALAAWQLPRTFWSGGGTEEAAMDVAVAEAPMLARIEEAAGDADAPAADEPMLMKDEAGIAVSGENSAAVYAAGPADTDALPDYVDGPAININSIPIQPRRQSSADVPAVGEPAAMKAASSPVEAPNGDLPLVAGSGAAPVDAPVPADYHRRALISATPDEIAETAPVNGADNVPAEPFETTTEAESDELLYCGILTLAEYEPDEDYPAEPFPGGCKYTLPVDRFYALVNALEQSGQPYSLRPGLFANTRPGLVIVTGGGE